MLKEVVNVERAGPEFEPLQPLQPLQQLQPFQQLQSKTADHHQYHPFVKGE